MQQLDTPDVTFSAIMVGQVQSQGRASSLLGSTSLTRGTLIFFIKKLTENVGVKICGNILKNSNCTSML